MATANPFDLLGDDDNEDPSQLLAKAAAAAAASGGKKAAVAPSSASAKLPSKPLPPSEAVREAKTQQQFGRGGGRGGRGGGRGGGHGGAPFRDYNTNGSPYNNGFSGAPNVGEDGDGGRTSERTRGSYSGPRAPYRGGRRGGGYGDGDIGDLERPRRQFERRSGTGRGTEFKREGAGRGNWGSQADEAFVQLSIFWIFQVMDLGTEEVTVTEGWTPEKEPRNEDVSTDAKKEDASKETEEKEPEDKRLWDLFHDEILEFRIVGLRTVVEIPAFALVIKEMTLEEYEKIREEKRTALLATKAEERKVVIDKELKSMQQLSLKKDNDDVFIKLGSDKDLARRKENAEKDERMKKAVSINEFLKPAGGERYYTPRGRGRGRGRGDHGGFRGSFAGGEANTRAAPAIEDPGQFPTLGGK
ncbi:hypothetical protein EJ110_NYTH42275 [Nymphaea thermarum]|nr:hypothetical protein EJ110_NYTH42275 [Nymphaea thermarum]